ncbi:MAG: hypothetical protein PHO67_01160 [Candidatus Omnitrophica bacterium]|nr:hypothetical protein [Candidatus Omnitrophota bacterium]
MEGEKVNLGLPNFLPGEKVFSLEFNGEAINVPYLLQVEEPYSADAFEMHLFINAATHENDIFRVYEVESGEIIGWLFPVQALLSVEHDYANDEYFLPCAFAAFQKLLQGEGLPAKTPILKTEQLSILDFYNDSDIVLLLAKNQISKIKDFNIKFYLPDLFKYGYRYKDKIETVNKRVSKFYEELDKNIKLRKMSSRLIANTYIYDLFTDILDDNDVIHAFLSLYQVIEIVIFDIFKDELAKCLDDYSNLSENDYGGFFDIGDKLNSIKSEKNRVANLFNYTNDTLELRDLCNNLLQQLSLKTEDNAAKALYSVRSNLVHAYRLFSKPQKIILEEVVEEFIGVIIDLVICYKKDIK